MTKTQHPPGPWHVVDGIVCDNYGQDLLSPVLFDAFPDEFKANARLIAAAPDLLAELKILEAVAPEQWAKTARALIAKVEGQSHE